jgi:hypothetical protein
MNTSLMNLDRSSSIIVVLISGSSKKKVTLQHVYNEVPNELAVTFSVSSFRETYNYDLFQMNLESFHNGWYQSQCGLTACFITNMLHCQLLYEFPHI